MLSSVRVYVKPACLTHESIKVSHMTTKQEPTPLRQQIDQQRKERSMTTKALYTKAEISRASYYRKITGKQDFTLAELQRIAKALNCNIEILFTPQQPKR